jgi:hypothetical protein
VNRLSETVAKKTRPELSSVQMMMMMMMMMMMIIIIIIMHIPETYFMPHE